jgi:hypothetical protein
MKALIRAFLRHVWIRLLVSSSLWAPDIIGKPEIQRSQHKQGHIATCRQVEVE